MIREAPSQTSRRDGSGTAGGRRAVLFDVDGVLLDSMAVYRRVWESWSIVCGLDPEAVWALTPGRRPADTIEAVAPHLDLTDQIGKLTSLLDSELERLRAMPGAAQLLASLPRQSWALVTSNTEPVVRTCFARLGLPSPQLVVDADAVEFGKPHPEGFLKAASALDVLPARCLVIEDATAGVAAALAAGMTVFGINSTEPLDPLPGAHRTFPSLRAASTLIQEWLRAPQSVPGSPPPTR